MKYLYRLIFVIKVLALLAVLVPLCFLYLTIIIPAAYYIVFGSDILCDFEAFVIRNL